MKQDFIDRSYLNAQENFRISSVKDGPICVLNDSISKLEFNKILEYQNGKFQINKEKYAGDNLITNCLKQDYVITKTVFRTNSEILETQDEAVKVTECLQRHPIVLLTRLDSEKFGQLFFDKICMNSVEINNNNSTKTAENFQFSSPDKMHFSENVAKDSNMFLPQKIEVEMMSESALDRSDTNDIVPVCSPTSSVDENEDQALPLVISEARWNAKDNFYDNKPIKGNQSDNASYFNSNIVDSNVVEPFFSLLEAIESNNHTASKVSQSSPSKKTSSVTTSTMLSECSLPTENIPVSGVSCSVDKVSDSEFRFRGPIYERSVAKDNHSNNFDKCLLPKLNSRKHLRSRRKCHRVVNYSDDFLLDCLLDNMDKAHKKSRRNKSRNLTPFMKEIRKKTAVCSKYRKRSELGISSGQRFDSGDKITQKRTNTVLDSLATHENNVHEEVKPIKIVLFDTNDEVHTDETYERKIGGKGNLKDTKLSSSSLKSERKYTSKASRMRAVFQKLEKEINFSLTATCSRKKTLASDEESIESIKLTHSPKEAKPQSTSLDLSSITQNDKSFSVETHFLQKRSSQGLRRERKHRKRGNKVASQGLSPDHSHDQQASLSMKTKKRRWQMNDDEAPLKRLAREIPRFNWLEDKIKNSSQTCSSQLVKETKTEKSVKTMDNSSVLKKKVISNSKFDENISGAAQSRSLYMKTYDTKSNFKDIEKSMETVENGSDHKEKNTSEQWQTFYKETDVLPQTGCEKKSSNLPANQLLPYEPSDQSVPSDDQKQEKSIISPPPLLYRHTPSPVLKIQQELTMNPMEPTNSKTLNMDEVLTKNAKDNFQAMISTLDQDLQQETSIVHKDLGSSSSKFRSIRPKIDPIFISRKPFFSFTKPTEAEYYIPKLATEEFNGFESLRKRGSINTMCSVQDSVSKQGEKVDSQFGSKDSSLTEDDVYERESHKLGSLRLYEHDSNTSYINCSSVKSITSFPSSNKIEAPTADDLTDYSKETMENDTKLNHTVSKDIVLSSERLVKTTDLDGHLPRDNSKGHLHEYICPSVTYDVVAQGSTKGSVVLQQNEHTASHTLANSNKFKTPVTSHDDISFKQITFSESKQKTGQHSSRFQVTKSSPLNQTLESKSSPQNDQSWKELSSPVQSQGNNLTYQHTSKHYHSEAMSGSDSRNNSDFSQSNEDSSACNEHQQKQFNQQWNVHDGKSKGIIWKDSDVLSEHMNKQEDSAVQLLRRTSNITSLSPKVPNMSAHSIELKLQAIQTFDENSKGLPISSFTSVEEIQHVISDDQFSRNNSINTPEKLANQHRNPLVDNICHLRKEISGHKENNFYKSKACRLEKDSLNSSNSAGYLSLKRKRLLNYAMDREREIAENQEDETKFGMEKTENSIDDTTKPSLKPQLHNEKIENAIEDNEIQVIFEIDKTEITHQNNNDHFLKLASSDTKLAPCEIVENWSDKNENLQDKPVSCVENSQNQSITRLVGSSDEPKKILVIESLAQKHRNKKQSVNRKSQTESGLAESPNIPININDSPKRSTSPSFFIETYETSFDKRQNECSFVTKERHCFRSLKEEMQTRKKELIILDNLAKQRENEYKELLRTRKEKYKLLLMLEQCFPKLHDSPPKLEHRNNKPIKNETLSIDKCTKETSHTLDKALDLHPEKAQEKPKNPVFNIESHSMETKSAIFNKGGFTNHHTSDTDTLSNLITANATISSRESDSDKRVVDASNLSWSIRDLKTKGVYSHMLSSTEINPLNSKPVPLVQPHASTTSPQMVPPVSIGNDLNSVLNSCLNTSKWTKHEQTSNREEGKNPIEKKITFPSATAVVPVTDSSFNLSEMSSVKQPSISNLDHHAFYRNHMTSLSNFYSTHPSFQSNFIGEQKNTNCEVCERITGCSANKHNPDVCFSRYYVQHQNSIKRHEHKNENRNQNLTVRPNMFPHHTAINPLLIAPLGEPNKVVHSFRQESTEKLRTSPENLHRSYNQNFITSNQNIGSRMPVTQRSEVTMNNCRSPDVSSLTRLMPMMSSNRSRVNVRPLIQQFPHHTVQQYRDVSNIINPQALSSENPLQSAWPQQQMMVNYPLSQSLEYLSRDTKVMEKHHSIFNSNHQSQSSNPHCGFCGKKAIFMCSGCKQNWYCGEPCQVKHWPTHSRFCRNLNHCV